MSRASVAMMRRRPTVVAEAITLLVLSMLAGAVNWARLEPRLPLVADLTAYEFELAAPLLPASEAVGLYDEGAYLFIDCRPRTPAPGTAIPGAFPIGVRTFDDDLVEWMDFIYPEDPLILYGGGGGDLQTVSAVAARFAERGYSNLWILAGGLDSWRAAGGELSEPGGTP